MTLAISKTREEEDKDTIKELEGLFGKGQESDIIKVLKELMDLEHNLEGKTHLNRKEVMQLTKLYYWCETMNDYSPLVAQRVAKLGLLKMKLLVSLDRKGRKEIIEAIKNQDTGIEKKAGLLSRWIR